MAAVCTDCETQAFDPKELKWALILLAVVTSLFLVVCTCRCYPKFKEVCTTDPEERARLRSRLHSEARAAQAAARRTSSSTAVRTALPQLPNTLASKSSCTPYRSRKAVVNSKDCRDPATIKQFAGSSGPLHERTSDRRRKSYPRSIRCSSSIPPSSDLFSVPETQIAVSPSRAAMLPTASRRFGSAQLTNALVSPNAIVRHSRKRPVPTSSPCHHHRHHQHPHDMHRNAIVQRDGSDGTFVHDEYRMSMEPRPPAGAAPPSSPLQTMTSSGIACIQDQSNAATTINQQQELVTRIRMSGPGSPGITSGRRCSELATIDPSSLHHQHHQHQQHHHCAQHDLTSHHNTNNSMSSSQQEPSYPRFLNLTHQTQPAHDCSRGSSPRNSLQYAGTGKEPPAKVRFEEVS